MTDELREAIDAACSVGARRAGFDTMRARLLEFLRNAPEEMSVRELLDEIG